MDLTTVEANAVIEGEPVVVTVGETRCVLIREDIFNRVKRVVSDDMDPSEAYSSIVAAWDDEPDEGLVAYQDYKQKS